MEGNEAVAAAPDTTSAAQRARAERNRLRARVLRDARVSARAPALIS